MRIGFKENIRTIPSDVPKTLIESEHASSRALPRKSGLVILASNSLDSTELGRRDLGAMHGSVPFLWRRERTPPTHRRFPSLRELPHPATLARPFTG